MLQRVRPMNRNPLSARFSYFFVVALGLLAFSVQAAELSFKRYFSDGMVLQREKAIVIRGFSREKAIVDLQFSGQKKTTTANNKGEWEIELEPLKASAVGELLQINSEGKELRLEDVIVGDVFLFARQSSIDLSLGKDRVEELKSLNLESLPVRAIKIETIPSTKPLSNLAEEATSGWSLMTAEKITQMDAAAVHFAAGVSKNKSLPIGIISLDMKHYFPIGWMSREDLMETAKVYGEDKTVVEGQVEKFTLAAHEYDSGEVKKTIDDYHAEAVKKAEDRGQPIPPEPVLPPHPVEDPRFPGAGYNSVLHSLGGVGLKAVLLQIGNDYPYSLYQQMDKEGQSLRRGRLGLAWKETYDLKKWCIYMEPYTLPRIVKQWRHYVGDLELPFGLITPPSSDLGTLAQHHVEIRELQRRISVDHLRVGLIIPDMEHVPFSAQPIDHKVIAERSLAWVRGEVYRESEVSSSGPAFDRVETNYSEATLYFKAGTAKGLKASTGALEVFEVAGTNGEYSPAKAVIEEEVIHLSSESVNRIVHVRYNWKQKPSMGLTNQAGLPAIPFRTDRHKYPRTIKHTESGLPSEYSTPAKDWTGGDVAIINGSLSRGNWHDGEGWLGVTGLMVAPFGPNMGVIQVLEGSPADGKISVEDVIYDVNGELLSDHPLKDVAQALIHAESEAGQGKIVFGLRRGGKVMNVELKVEVLGSYSSTSPYDCQKTDRIVANMEKFLAARGGTMKSHTVFSNTDALFMLAAGTPEYQGLVRRKVYDQMASFDYEARIDPLQKRHPQNWHFAYNALLTSEYFLATGDRNVLPFLKWNLDYLAVTQNKVEATDTPWPRALAGSAGGWRHNFYGGLGYGMLPTIGVPAILSFRFAMDIGLEVDRSAYERGLGYFKHNGVEVGQVIYGNFSKPYTDPAPIDMEAAYHGKLPASNGMRGLAAILYDRIGDKRTASICSFYAANAFNNLAHAHGGNFWGNWANGAGAYLQGKKAFIRFMQGHAWYRDLHRMYNHSLYQGNGGIGGGQLLSLVLPRHRIRLLGAPESVFVANPKEVFRPALDAHKKRDYPLVQKLAQEILDTQVLSPADKAKAQQLVGLSKELQESIGLDIKKVERLIEEEKYYEAMLDLPQLQGVVSRQNPRLVAIEKVLLDPALGAVVKKDEERYKDVLSSLKFDVSQPKSSKEDEARWSCLTPHSKLSHRMPGMGKVSNEEANRWKFKVVESLPKAPEGWTEPEYDDSAWLETVLPISWYLNHQALLRTTFEVTDKSSIEALRVRTWTYRQQNVQIFINGKLVAKINQASNNATLNALLSEGALKALKNGKNTLAVTTLNNWRWGRYMTKFETDARNSVYNNGYTILLDMRRK